MGTKKKSTEEHKENMCKDLMVLDSYFPVE